MRLLHLSDLHLCSNSETVIYGVNPYENLQRAIRKIQSIEKPIDLCVVTGDISNDGSKESYELADMLLSSLPFPIFVTNGNHDNYHNLVDVQHHKICFQHELTFQGIEFVFLNSVAIAEDGSNRSKGMLSTSEIDRLTRLSFLDKPAIIIMHHPVLSSGSWMGRRILINRELFLSIVNTTPQIIAVLSGHNHCSSKNYVNHCFYSTSPSVSTTYSKNLSPYEEAFTPGFDLLCINGSTISVENTIDF